MLAEDAYAVDCLRLHRDLNFPFTNDQGLPTHVPYTVIDVSPARDI